MNRTTNFFLALFFTIISQALFAQRSEVPVAQKIPNQYVIFNDTVIDNYYWMRDKFNPEVINYLYSQNAYTDEVLSKNATLQKVMFEEMKGHRKETNTSRPVKRKGYYYYSRNVEGKDYAILCRKKDSLQAPEQVYMDINELAKEYQYFSLGFRSMSPNQQIFCYGVDDKGNRLNKLYIKYLVGDSTVNEKMDSVMSMVWCNNNRSFIYTKAEPKTIRTFKVFRHIIGTNPKNDVLIYYEPDKTFAIDISKSSSEKYLILNSERTSSSESWYMSADDSTAVAKLFKPRKTDVNYSIDHFGDDFFYITTNENAPNKKLQRIATNDLNNLNKTVEVLPARKKIFFDNYQLLKDYFIYKEIENVDGRIIIKRLSDNKTDTLQIKNGNGNIGFSAEDYNYLTTKDIQVNEGTMTSPTLVYNYNLLTTETKILEKDTILGNYNPDNYVTERLWAKASDGTLIPYTIAYKKGLQKNGMAPCILNGYGSYGSSQFPAFNSTNISLLDRGFVIALAHIRGGQEMGRYWYEEGRMLTKKNTFTDFIACAEDLIAKNYTSKEKICARGRSAGGLLMGAVTNMRPDLFKCVIAEVPFVDVMNTMLDETIPLTTFEYEEWGNPHIKKYYDYMKSYSPYDNVERKNYPAILIGGGYNDSQVGYWEPAKWYAKLLEYKTDTNELLLKINMNAGHGYSSGKYDALKEEAQTVAFIMKQLGVKQEYITVKGVVTDAFGEPMPYAYVVIENTTNGTLTNFNGEFEIDLRMTDKPVLVFQAIGFKKERLPIEIKTKTNNLKIKLKSEDIQLKTVVIKANSKDPAYDIMRKAIDNRKMNLERNSNFVADIYIRNTTRLIKLPKKIPSFMMVGMADTSKGIVYMSESIAKYARQYPDKVKEEMFASKVAGTNKGFSWNRVADLLINFYEPSTKLQNYSERPFVSPLSPVAMAMYKFKYKGSFIADGKSVDKIEVIPRFKGDPLYRGNICITEDDYQIYSCDLYLTKDAGIDFTDTLNISEEFTKSNAGYYVPTKIQYKALISIFGIKATDITVGSLSNYNMNPAYNKKYFGYEVFKITKDANKRDTTYWKTTRPILLTTEEVKHYKKEDSLAIIKNSPAYRDSVNRRNNKFKLGNFILGGYTYRNQFTYEQYGVDGLLLGTNYNTVEGVNLAKTFRYFKYNDTLQTSTWCNANVKYGFGNKTWYGSLAGGKSLSGKTSVSFHAGRQSFQYNNYEPITGLINSLYTLLAEQNFSKIYLKDYFQVKLNHQILPGLNTQVNLQYAIRTAMINHTDFTFIDYPKRTFTSNNPLNFTNDAYAFRTHQTINAKVFFKYTPFMKYETIGNRTRYIGSKYPEFYGGITQGVGVKNASFNYSLFELGAGKDFEFGIFGLFKIDAMAGKFMNTSGMNFIDYKHFSGNQTIYSANIRTEAGNVSSGRDQLNRFYTLPYYSFSTNKQYLEVHAEHNFRGFLVGKIPLLRKTKVYEIAALNMLMTENKTYYEVAFGIDNIFKVFRVDFASALNNGKLNAFNVRLGFRFF